MTMSKSILFCSFLFFFPFWCLKANRTLGFETAHISGSVHPKSFKIFSTNIKNCRSVNCLLQIKMGLFFNAANTFDIQADLKGTFISFGQLQRYTYCLDQQSKNM